MNHKNFIDLSGRKYGKWNVIERGENSTGARFKCICECGTEGLVLACNLASGKSKGCKSCAARKRVEIRWNNFKKSKAAKWKKINQ